MTLGNAPFSQNSFRLARYSARYPTFWLIVNYYLPNCRFVFIGVFCG